MGKSQGEIWCAFGPCFSGADADMGPLSEVLLDSGPNCLADEIHNREGGTWGWISLVDVTEDVGNPDFSD